MFFELWILKSTGQSIPKLYLARPCQLQLRRLSNLRHCPRRLREYSVPCIVPFVINTAIAYLVDNRQFVINNAIAYFFCPCSIICRQLALSQRRSLFRRLHTCWCLVAPLNQRPAQLSVPQLRPTQYALSQEHPLPKVVRR